MAARFDASTDILTYTGTGPAIATTGVTVCFWVYLAVDLNTYGTLCRLQNGGTTVFSIGLEADGTSLWVFGPSGTFDSTHDLTAGAWSRVSLTISAAGVANLYTATATGSVNTVTNTSGTGTGTAITLGSRPDNSEWANVRLSDVRFWDVVLTSTEIELEWASSTPIRRSNLWADWPLRAAGQLMDQSGNNRTLTAGSTAVSTESDPIGRRTPSGLFLGYA